MFIPPQAPRNIRKLAQNYSRGIKCRYFYHFGLFFHFLFQLILYFLLKTILYHRKSGKQSSQLTWDSALCQWPRWTCLGPRWPVRTSLTSCGSPCYREAEIVTCLSFFFNIFKSLRVNKVYCILRTTSLVLNRCPTTPITPLPSVW